jgi:hypothetical protein
MDSTKLLLPRALSMEASVSFIVPPPFEKKAKRSGEA